MPNSHRPLLASALALLLSTPALAFGGPTPTWIDLYGGWASPHGGHLYARVHKGNPPKADSLKENSAEKFIHTLEQLELDALKGATVNISVQLGKRAPQKFTAHADDHGFIDFKLPAGMTGPLARVTMSVPASKTQKASTASYAVPVWSDKPGAIGVISDIDDTLTDSDVPHKLHLAWNTFFHSTYDVKVFPGSGAVLKQITAPVRGFPVRPLFFLTGSPWNLHTRIAGAFQRAGIPNGAFVLRRFSKEPMKAYDFKHPHLQEIFAMFPNTRWVLFGDTGEQDPEVYKQMSVEKPSNISHIFIHNVTKADPHTDRFAFAAGHMSVFNAWPELNAQIAQDGLVFGHGTAAAAAH